MSLAEYLAKTYPSKDNKKKKSKKKSEKKSNEVQVLDSLGWEGIPEPTFTEQDDDDVVQDPTEKKSAGWKRVGDKDKDSVKSSISTASYSKEDSSTSGDPLSAPPISRPGLQTAQQIAADVAAKEAYEKRLVAESSNQSESQSETVYRDASGRRIDLQRETENAELQRQEEEKQKEKLRREINRGLVQQEEKQKRDEKLEKLRHAPLALSENDKQRNDEMKEQDLYDDPAAAFLPKKKSSKRKSKSGDREDKTTYRGPFPPNRFNIAPGYRWDGVDRSNGFESKWFNAQTVKQEAKYMKHAMATDYD